MNATRKLKTSGLDWSPEVPAHWTVKKLGFVALLQSGEGITAEDIKDTGLHPVYGGNGLRGFTDAFTHRGHYVLVGRQGALCGNVNYANGEFWASEHALVATPCEPISVIWFGELLRAMNLNQYSLSAAQPGLAVESISALRIPVPPLDEQQGIADFLDRETARLDALMAEKERWLELVAEKRRTLITSAVTRGLNPAAPLRDSGLAWLGQVPTHWEVLKLRRVTVSRCDGPFGSGLKSEHYTDEGVRVIRLQNIRFASFDENDKTFIDADYYKELGDHDVFPGDVLIAGLGDERYPVGRACVAPETLGQAMVKADCFRFRLDPQKADSHFIAFQLSSMAAALDGAFGTGTTRLRMNMTDTSDRYVALPKSTEQRAIVAHISAETAKLDGLRAATERTIGLLKERRAALIAAAVTGKLDVAARQ